MMMAEENWQHRKRNLSAADKIQSKWICHPQCKFPNDNLASIAQGKKSAAPPGHQIAQDTQICEGRTFVRAVKQSASESCNAEMLLSKAVNKAHIKIYTYLSISKIQLDAPGAVKVERHGFGGEAFKSKTVRIKGTDKWSGKLSVREHRCKGGSVAGTGAGFVGCVQTKNCWGHWSPATIVLQGSPASRWVVEFRSFTLRFIYCAEKFFLFCVAFRFVSFL